MTALLIALALYAPQPRQFPPPLTTAELVMAERALLIEMKRTTTDPETYIWADATLIELDVLYPQEADRGR